MTRAVGIDISKYQVYFNPQLATEPIDFVIQRLSYGMREDEKRLTIWEGVKQIEERGAYHYYSTGSPWIDQADFFLDLTLGKKFKALIVDYEHGYNNLNKRTALELGMFLAYLKKERPGKKILGYSNTPTYRDDIEYYIDLEEWDWMFARYPFIAKPQTGHPVFFPNTKREQSNWTKWQYSSKGKAIKYGTSPTNTVDLVVFNGTVDEMRKYYSIEEPTPPPPSPPPPVPPPVPVCIKEQKAVLEKVLNFVRKLSDDLG